jgi:HD-GYP domain-containing protein (c-di-GMP phosphodiesterase class II)
MRKKIPTEAVRMGMYIDGFDASWLKTPFLTHHFEIKSKEQLEKILSSAVTHVYIDTEKGLDVLSEEEARRKSPEHAAPPAPTPAPAPAPAPRPDKDAHPLKKMLADYIKAKNDLIQIDKLSLIEGTTVGFALFAKTDMEVVPLPLTRDKNGEPLITQNVLNFPGELMINRSDADKYREYLRMAIKDAGGQARGFSQKNMLIKENAKILVQDLFNTPGSPEKMEACKETTENVISSIIDSKGLITNLFTVNKHDYYIYTHSVNVAVFSVATAIAIGIQSEGELFAIGMGSLLHDIGLSTIPPEVLYKPGERLTDFETGLLRGHVVEGRDIVKLYKGIPPETMIPLMEHHEDLMGTGYPMGKKGDKLHVSGKIISITNIYDTLTTSRPGTKAITPYEALTYLLNNANLYDADILKEFITVLGKSSGG